MVILITSSGFAMADLMILIIFALFMLAATRLTARAGGVQSAGQAPSPTTAQWMRAPSRFVSRFQ